MKSCIKRALLVLILTNYSLARSHTQQSNFFGTLNPGQYPANPVRFKDDFTVRGITETNSLDSDGVLVNIKFDDENYYQNELELDDRQNIKRNQKFEDAKKIKFESNDVEEFDEERTSKPIKFEGNGDESDDTTKTKHVVFEKQETRKKKVRRAREEKLHIEDDPAPKAMMSPYPGLGSYGYPGSGYLGASFPTTSDPKSVYQNYLTGYPASSFPYAYSTSNPGMAYPTQSYPGYTRYPGSTYPPVNTGYIAYPTAGYQNSVDTRPANPVNYPGPPQVDQGPSNIRYPSQEYQSGVSPGPAQNAPNEPNSYHNSGYPGSYYLSYPASAGYQPGYPGEPSSQYPVQGQRPYSPGYQTAYPPVPNGPYNRPSRRPKSLTQRAVSAVAEALTSIALYDDYQCVPRMLCEVAGGSTASSPTLLKATAGLQPLLTLLQSFDGVSTSPLLVFGRAAVLGVTSKNNPAACRKAYPQCPNDPEKLVYYLNNHNGGFFRFFGHPELSQQQHNLEQFYGYLSGQYGLLQPQGQPNKYPNPGYGLLPQNSYNNVPNYGGQVNYRDAKDIKIEAEERIQNKPHVNALDEVSSFDADQGPKWAFPEDDKSGDKEHVFIKEPERAIRESNSLKFPDDRPVDKIRYIRKPIDYVRKQKKVFFPEGNNYQTDEENNFYFNNHNQRPVEVDPDDYVFDYNHNIFVERPKAVRHSDVTTLYVVRGNGDPNHPEIVNVRPGQSV